MLSISSSISLRVPKVSSADPEKNMPKAKMVSANTPRLDCANIICCVVLSELSSSISLYYNCFVITDPQVELEL